MTSDFERIASDLVGVRELIKVAQAITATVGGDDAESLRHMAVLVQAVTYLEAQLVVAVVMSPLDAPA